MGTLHRWNLECSRSNCVRGLRGRGGPGGAGQGAALSASPCPAAAHLAGLWCIGARSPRP